MKRLKKSPCTIKLNQMKVKQVNNTFCNREENICCSCTGIHSEAGCCSKLCKLHHLYSYFFPSTSAQILRSHLVPLYKGCLTLYTSLLLLLFFPLHADNVYWQVLQVQNSNKSRCWEGKWGYGSLPPCEDLVTKRVGWKHFIVAILGQASPREQAPR